MGAATALSPVLMVIIEGLKSEQAGISFMLFNYYMRDVNNATLGIVISLLIDLISMGLSTLVCAVQFLGSRQYSHSHPCSWGVTRRRLACAVARASPLLLLGV